MEWWLKELQSTHIDLHYLEIRWFHRICRQGFFDMLIVPPDFCHVQLKIPKQICEEDNGHPTLCVSWCSMGCYESPKFSVGKHIQFFVKGSGTLSSFIVHMLHYFNRTQQINTRWWFQELFIFTPSWGYDPIWRAYFSDGLVQPPDRCSSQSVSTGFFQQDTMEHKITEALGKGSLYEAAAKSIAPEIFGHQDVTWRKNTKGVQSGPLP